MLEEARERIRLNEWLYWRPILAGVVQLTKREWDRSGPQFLIDLNAALDVKHELEMRAQEEAKSNAESR
jgi:hypothetical protein